MTAPGDMTLVEHLDELRGRLLKSLLALALTMALSLAMHRQLIAWLRAPAADTAFVFTAPPEYLMAALKVAFYAGLYLALPVILYQVLAFVAPGLHPHERRWVAPIAAGAFLLFSAGAAFAYWVLLPTGLHFLLTFSADAVTPMLSIGAYLGFAAALVFASGLIFELPLVLLALALAGLVSSRRLASWRRGALLVAIALGALITPGGDVFSQLLLAGALYGLYELSLALIRLIGR